ncbi:hypothetical protein K402DRAFT_416089 [Aulographum hederae CBS 113979]|uniref:Uncharacterized protein n=1 Tax=Aulographum hederae CBS 113979 TaxID=1176131 RepID=A0A6G1HGR6_9PEZI|nr:hypothetical protein K402DRAFT_416089 [Aulographum hederae CBS 113979]
MSIDRDGFVFNNFTLLAEVGSNGHPRASQQQLIELLRPKVNPSRYADGPKLKDPVWHWYEAQLCHYGLQRTSNKNMAKVRLLNALNDGVLNVPSHLRNLEMEMKIDFVKQKSGN